MVIIKRGGVNDALKCPVRVFLGVGCTPFFISTAEPSQAVSEGLGGWKEVACGGGATTAAKITEKLFFCRILLVYILQKGTFTPELAKGIFFAVGD